MPNRADDHATRLNRVEDAVVADARCPESRHSTDESLAHFFRLELDQDERFEHRLTYRVR